MPPGNQSPRESVDTGHMLPRHAEASGEGGLTPHKKSSGAIVGIAIIVLLAIFGALYFWGALLNQEGQNPPPFIPPEQSISPTQ